MKDFVKLLRPPPSIDGRGTALARVVPSLKLRVFAASKARASIVHVEPRTNPAPFQRGNLGAPPRTRRRRSRTKARVFARFEQGTVNMGKEKKEKKEKTPSKSKENDDDEGGELRPVCAIAKPLADIGFHKKILKVVKKGARKTQPPPPRPPHWPTPTARCSRH